MDLNGAEFMALFDIKPTIETSRELKKLLESFALDKRVVFYRGHQDASWKLEPSAFRESEIIASRKRFPLEGSELERWFTSQEVLSKINGLLPGLELTENNYKRLILGYKQHHIIPLYNILRHYINIMRYNYDLASFHTQYSSYYSNEYKNSLIGAPSNLEQWSNLETFVYFISSVGHMYDCTSLETGELLIEPWIDEGPTQLDETLVQHHGGDVKTAILDWSSDPYIALYFATFGITLTEPRYISIYRLVMLNQDSEILKVVHPNSAIKNLRAERQKGVFTLMPQANSSFLISGRHPTVEDYISFNGKDFLIEKYNIKLSHDILEFCKNILWEKGLTRKYLLPE